MVDVNTSRTSTIVMTLSHIVVHQSARVFQVLSQQKYWLQKPAMYSRCNLHPRVSFEIYIILLATVDVGQIQIWYETQCTKKDVVCSKTQYNSM